MTTPSMPLLPVEYPEPVVAQMLRRAGSRGYDAWWHRVRWSGFCATPIHLAEVAPTAGNGWSWGGATTGGPRSARRAPTSTPATPGS